MKMNLFQSAVSSRSRPRQLEVHPKLQRWYHNHVHPGITRLLTRTPPVFDISNIANYVAEAYPEFLKPNIASVSADADGGFPTHCDELDRVCELFRMPLHDFPAGGCWMERSVDTDKDRPHRRGWYIYATDQPFLDIMPRGRSLVFVEHDGTPGYRVRVEYAVQLLLDSSGGLQSECHLVAPRMVGSGAPATLLSTLLPEHVARIAPVIMALCILQSKTGFSMPVTERGRESILRRVGVRTADTAYWFEDGPRMRHFVRGHFRVYRRGRATPVTTWVVPHTRGARRPLMTETHRRRIVADSRRAFERSRGTDRDG